MSATLWWREKYIPGSICCFLRFVISRVANLVPFCGVCYIGVLIISAIDGGEVRVDTINDDCAGKTATISVVSASEYCKIGKA